MARKNNEFPTQKIGCRPPTHLWGAAPGKELFQTKVKIHKRLFALLLVFALVIGLLPSVLADNEPEISVTESAEETLVESQPEESPAISPPTQSILESDEAVESSETGTDNEAETPTSIDDETLTRTDNDGLMLLGGGGTMVSVGVYCVRRVKTPATTMWLDVP